MVITKCDGPRRTADIEISFRETELRDNFFINQFNMESYRSGHNGAHSKCVCLNGHEGSNPSLSGYKDRSSYELRSFFYSFAGTKDITKI